MWLFNLLSTYQSELLTGFGAGVVLAIVLQFCWKTLASGMRDSVSRRLMSEMNDPGTFVQIGMAFGLFLAGHMVVDAISRRKAPLSGEEGVLIYLLFMLAAFSLGMGLRATMVRLTRRLMEAEEKGKSSAS